MAMCRCTDGPRSRRLSIVIPNARTFPDKLVAALKHQTYEGDEILVVRNFGRAVKRRWVGVEPVAMPLPKDNRGIHYNDRMDGRTSCEVAAVRVIDLDEEYGAAAARNRGWREAGNELILFLDDDVLIEEDFLELVRRYVMSQPVAGIVTFRMRTVNPNPWSGVVETTISLDRGEITRVTDGRPILLPDVWMYGAGGAMLASADVLGKTGGFKSRLGAGHRNGGTEDAEFLWHASRHTVVAYCGTIAVRHEDVCTSNGLCRKLREYGRAIGHLGGATKSVAGVRYVCDYCSHILTGVHLRDIPGLRLWTFIRLRAAVVRATCETALAYFESWVMHSTDLLCDDCRGDQ